jgi:hypothetical protein
MLFLGSSGIRTSFGSGLNARILVILSKISNFGEQNHRNYIVNNGGQLLLQACGKGNVLIVKALRVYYSQEESLYAT